MKNDENTFDFSLSRMSRRQNIRANASGKTIHLIFHKSGMVSPICNNNCLINSIEYLNVVSLRTTSPSALIACNVCVIIFQLRVFRLGRCVCVCCVTHPMARCR